MKISNEDKQLIRDAIKKAESKTSGEIVPVIISRSDFYPAVHFRLALIVGILCSLIIYNVYDFDDPIVLIWGQFPGIFLGYFLGYIPFLKRLFTTKAEMQEEVYQQAIQMFYENSVSITKDRTGIMIFISLLERKVQVLADCGINEKVAADYWNNIVENILSSIKTGKLIEGMAQAIDSCGQSLIENFPIQDDDKNEISDELITDL